MKIKKISFSTSLRSIEDIYNGNIDIFVYLEDGSTSKLTIGTLKNFLALMNKDDFSPPKNPMIVVRKLTIKLIQ